MAKKRHYSMDSESSENTNRINIKKYTFWYIIVKMQKVKANNSPLKQLEKSSTLPIWNKNYNYIGHFVSNYASNKRVE